MFVKHAGLSIVISKISSVTFCEQEIKDDGCQVNNILEILNLTAKSMPNKHWCHHATFLKISLHRLLIACRQNCQYYFSDELIIWYMCSMTS